jgi:hypothetical protein
LELNLWLTNLLYYLIISRNSVDVEGAKHSSEALKVSNFINHFVLGTKLIKNQIFLGYSVCIFEGI